MIYEKVEDSLDNSRFVFLQIVAIEHFWNITGFAICFVHLTVIIYLFDHLQLWKLQKLEGQIKTVIKQNKRLILDQTSLLGSLVDFYRGQWNE